MPMFCRQIEISEKSQSTNIDNIHNFKFDKKSIISNFKANKTILVLFKSKFSMFRVTQKGKTIISALTYFSFFLNLC